MDRSKRGQYPRNGSMISTRQPLRIPTDINNDEQPDGLMKAGKMTSASSARSSTASDAQSGLYETIDDEGGIYDQGGLFNSNMSSSSRRHHGGPEKLDRTITRLYTYLSGSEEGEDVPANSSDMKMTDTHFQPSRNSNRRQQQPRGHHYQEPEYQQPYAYPPVHAQPFNPQQQVGLSAATGTSLGGSTPTSHSDDHASSEFSTFTESELALTHQATLPMGENEESRNILDELQFGPASSRSSMGRLNGQLNSAGAPAGGRPAPPTTSLAHRGVMMMSSSSSAPSPQHHYQLPPTSHHLHHHHQHYATGGKDHHRDDHDDEDQMEADQLHHHHHHHHVPTTLLKRTPSGALFIPSDNPINKGSTLEYKHNLASSPTSEKKQPDRCLMSFDTRLRMSGVRPQSSLFPTSPRGVNGPAGSLRKSLDLSSRCSWKCTAILFMLASAVLAAAVAYLTAAHFVNWPPQPAKSHHTVVEGGNEANEYVTAFAGDNSTRRPGSSGSNNNGGNVELVQQLRQAVRLAVSNVIRQQYPSATAENAALEHDPLSSLFSVVRSSFPRNLLRRVKRSNEDVAEHQDALIWDLLREWIAQEEHQHQADQPLELQDSSEGSGFDSTDQLPTSKGIVHPVSSAVGMEAERDHDEVDEPAAMALAESLILLHPAVRNHPAVEPVATLPVLHQDGSKESSISPVNRTTGAEEEEEAGGGGGELVFVAYHDHVIEIIQLEPPSPLPPPPLLLNKTRANPAAVGQPVSPDQPSHPSAADVADELLAPSASVSIGDPHSEHDVLLPSSATTRFGGGGDITSNDVLPPDPDIIMDADESNAPVLAPSVSPPPATGPPSSDWIALMAGNISEDVLDVDPWPDVISYRGRSVVHLPQINECDCSCQSSTILSTTLENLNPSTTPNILSYDDTTTTDPSTIPTFLDYADVTLSTTIESMSSTLTTPESLEATLPLSCPEIILPTCPVCPSTEPPQTTPSPTSTTTQLIPPILILEGSNTFPARSFPPDGTTFAQVTLGEKSSNMIPAYSYWNMQFYHSEPAYVKFELGLPRGASLGLYGRRNALPTHTNYDMLHIVSGYKNRNKRASSSLVTKEVLQYMEPGHWFVSLYNDDGDPQEATCLITLSRDMTLSCPRGCNNGNGECILGKCHCKSGFGGDDCSESVCPVLCSGRGDYINGQCQCNPGWKGRECSLKHDECEVPDCSGHGKCSGGKCLCGRGFKGEFCDIVDCPHPTCSDHGFCVDGTCLCKKGWKGLDCSQVDGDAMQCLPDCSSALGQGAFSLELHKCVCATGWTGEDCSKPACGINCGGHGRCESNACVCDPGWAGEFCQERLCDSRCNEHGQCKNGSCLCVTGWNGKHCTLEGCPNECSKRGQCKSSDGGWSCRCDKGWEGADCSVPLEMECEDGKDNDRDGLVDCEDADCCQTRHCKKSPFCVAAPKPIDILLRKQPPAVTASFYERMKFLIEEGSLQSYAKQDAFNESRAAVVRGKVVAASGLGLFGVRVSSSNPLEGFTLTRDDGWFDLMVNGGGSVVIHFGRTPFRPKSRTVSVPWNEVVILDVVTMTTEEEIFKAPVGAVCQAHDYDAMRPVVLATWKHGFQGSCPAQSAILAESQVVQESLVVPGTGAHLVYHSSRSSGYLSTIQLQLTPDIIPSSLSRIHLRITIEGVLFEKLFEADPGIKYTYAWNRFNVYRQRVYGVTTATVKVGYEYASCSDVIWEVQTTKLSGHDMSISDIGGWNLDIHHRYNFHEGILQKGDGSNMYLRYRPEVLRTIMGDGHQRPLECSGAACDGPASKQRVLAPVALVASPDGSLYLGDFNLVRRIGTDGTVKTILRLNTTRVSYRYHMALSPVDNILYLSDPEAHQIIRVRNMNDYSDPERNWEPIIGSGERCLPGDEYNCGDGGLAREAKLAYPKGVAVAADGTVYIADGTNIRVVDKDGLISTIVGNHQHRTHWNPMPCEGTLPLNEVRLRWPTEIAINPLDNSLHIIDDHMIVRLTSDGRMKVVAGKPLHCPAALVSSSGDATTDLATQAGLVVPQSLAFGPNGDLYVAESDSQRINRVRRIGTDGRIATVAGAESKCNCLDAGCSCYDEERHLAAASRFNTISAIAVDPAGVLFVCDQANYRLRAVTSSLPVSEPAGSTIGTFDIYSPETQEVYVFNRFGQHVATRSMVTGRNVYLFGYNVNTSNGKVSTVTDSAGNKIFLFRDYSNQVTSIENTRGHKCRLRMTRTRLLQEFSTPEGRNITFDYHGSTGLLKSRSDSGRGQSVTYQYDENGRLISAVSPTGEPIKLNFDLSLKGASVEVVHGQRSPVVYFIKPGWSVSRKVGLAEEVVSMQPDRSVIVLTPFGHLTATETIPYGAVLGESDSLAETFPVPAKQKVEIGGELVSRLEWRYFVRRRRSASGTKETPQKEIVQLGKKMRVNGENLLTVEYDKESLTEAVFMEDRAVELLNITYDDMSRPISWVPGRSSSFAAVEVNYDRFGQLALWKQGDLSEAYNYDRSGRLAEVVFADGHKLVYTFRDAFTTLPSQISTERGHTFSLHHDAIGALQSITTPRGHIHSFGLQMVPGGTKFLYHSPANRQPYQLLLDDQGRLQVKTHPGSSARQVYLYNSESRLAKIVSGAAETSLDYYADTGLLKMAEVKERPSYEVRHEFKYHGGLVKEERIKYGSKTGLDNARTRCKYDGNGRLSLIETEVNGKELPPHAFAYNQNLGLLEGVNDLRVYRNAFNRTVIQDSTKHYFRISDRDSHGRTSMTLVNIKGYDTFKFELDFDVRGRVRHRRVTIGQKVYSSNLTYNAEGSLLQVQKMVLPATTTTGRHYTYTYDDNGNIISMSESGGVKSTLVYDAGDRVSSFGDGQQTVMYDSRGFVVRRGPLKLAYNDRGQLSYAADTNGNFRVWYNYDYRGRLAVWRDDKGNVTQFFYTNPLKPNLLTHLHWPKESRTLRMYYDVSDHLIAVESPEQRWYVASDEVGTPLVIFNVHGTAIKMSDRTPFGLSVLDTDPSIYIGVDFRGGILSPHTGLIHFGGRVYDPMIAQWLTPEWEQLVSQLTQPQDIFIYRFLGNDPVNVDSQPRYMSSLDSWLELFGYSWNNIIGTEYSPTTKVFNPTSDEVNTIGHFGVISGLRCLTENVQNGFSVLSFVPPPSLKSGGEVRRNPLPVIAYRKPALGEGILLSRVGGKASVTLVQDSTTGSNGGSNGVLQDVLGSVLGDSAVYWLDVRSGGPQESFYFVKESSAKLRDDQEDLKRLSGQFNITLIENGAEQGGGTELRVTSAELAISITYGVDADTARQRVLRQSHRRAVESAWLREKQLVESGLPGQQVDWSIEERVELLTNGRVNGFIGSDLHSVYEYPQLADDASNIVFRRDETKRKRRNKSRHQPRH